ncbi:MAG: hypothetical protein J6L47_01005 [Alphaproteobacteria bacterium]|nr:hypothetical protein [Alphaproteobacteria bacterium]
MIPFNHHREQKEKQNANQKKEKFKISKDTDFVADYRTDNLDGNIIFRAATPN